MYDKVHALGKMLKDSKPSSTDDGSYIPPALKLSKDDQNNLENEIRSLTIRSSRYLDQCSMKPNRPLWHYDHKNPETHMSAPEFKYGHLVA